MQNTLEWVSCSLQKHVLILNEATSQYLHRQQLLFWLHHTQGITIAANICFHEFNKKTEAINLLLLS